MATSFTTTEAGHTPSLTTPPNTNSTPAATAAPPVTSIPLHSNSQSNTDSTSNNRPTPNNNRNPRTSSLRLPNNPNQHNNTTDYRSENSSNDEHNTGLHYHRQSHNSSKLPAFRFADLKKDALVLPTLIIRRQQLQPQQQHDPPSPVSPRPAPTNPGRRSAESTEHLDQTLSESPQRHRKQNHLQDPEPLRDSQDRSSHSSPQLEQSKPPKQTRHIPASSPESKVHNEHRNTKNSPVSPEPLSEPTSHQSPSIIRASTFETALSTNPPPLTSLSSSSKRPASFPDSPAVVAKLSGATTTTKSQHRGPPDITSPESSRTSADQRPGLTHSRRTASDSATKDWAQGQRELLLPKTVDTTKPDDKRRSRPPVSFRQPAIVAAASGRPVIPPIRSFRSSGSRKSLVLDMHTRRVSDSSDGSSDPHHRDRTLRALEGRSDDEYSQMTPPDSAEATPDENTADIFMRIAREDPAPRGRDGNGAVEEPSGLALTRLRSSHRRPFSTAAAAPSYQTSSPPQVPRRLSDQRENSSTSRARRLTIEQPAQQLTRELNYRGMTREQPPPASANRAEEPCRTQSGRVSSLRPSPITPRTLAFQDSQSEVGSTFSRRRQSVTEGIGGLSSRASQLRSTNVSYGQGRTYNSSPLVPRSIDVSSHHQEANNGVEGTESSTASTTAAPSMIWDELDDLKSRIHRLELTGKPPATSAQAMSRVSDERPATAVTNATTMSASPKRSSATNPPQPDEASTTSSQREAQPILLSALSKTKGVVSPDVYSAIESAANDALALTSMMGAPGQPGPISSGVSTIGGGGSVTDRQLRKKAESICRSLTELCLSLTDEAPAKPTHVVATTAREKETLASPTTFTFTGITSQRRPSALMDQAIARLNPAPRTPSSLEQRRTTLLSTPVLSSPRFAHAPGTPTEAIGAGRKSSLLAKRTRRAGTEEPEESSGRKSSLLLRTRRAGTEEPEEGRKTSLLLRARRGTNDDEDDSKFRAPSRATTEVNHLRNLPRDYTSQQDSGASSALPRRRLAPSGLNSRLLPPSSPATSTPPASATGRRFLERSTPDRDTSSVAEKLAEDRAQRQYSLSQTAMLNRNRTGSLSRRRDSAIPSISSSTSQVGTYR